jgi:hypothetical protein
MVHQGLTDDNIRQAIAVAIGGGNAEAEPEAPQDIPKPPPCYMQVNDYDPTEEACRKCHWMTECEANYEKNKPAPAAAPTGGLKVRLGGRK